MYGSSDLSANLIEKKPFMQRPFVDITESYSDRLANVANIRRGKPLIEERKPTIIQPEQSQPKVYSARDMERENPFNQGINTRLEGKSGRKVRGAMLSYKTVFSICKALHNGSRICDVVQQMGVCASSVQNIKLRKTSLSIRCWDEVEGGAKRPTGE